MAETDIIVIIKQLKCPDSMDISYSLSETRTGFPLRLAKLAAQGAAASRVLKAIDNAASINKCPAGCKKELSDIKHQAVSFECKRIWWTFWTNHSCKCTITLRKTLTCVPIPEDETQIEQEATESEELIPESETQTEPEVAELEELFPDRGFLEMLISSFAPFLFPLIFLCIFLFLARSTYIAVISPFPTAEPIASSTPTLTTSDVATPLSVISGTTSTPEPTRTDEPVTIATFTPSVSSNAGEIPITFNTNVNLREGPSIEYEVIWTFEQGTSTSIIGRYENSSWILVRINDPERTRKQCGWVSVGFFDIDVSGLTVLNSMPDVYDCPQ
ncbi:MAG: SH3 domain-containing protein [Chloroflexi bacterium]|nr:SH3 domain-containing protein [Chloroflexota bacterium]